MGYTDGTDIGYRRPITYRGLRFIALIAMTLSQYAVIIHLVDKAASFMLGSAATNIPDAVYTVVSLLGQITFPLLLIASFATVFSRTDGLKKVLIMNLVLAGITFIFCAFFLESLLVEYIEAVPVTVLEATDTDSIIKILQEHPEIFQTFGLDMSNDTISSLVQGSVAFAGQLDVAGLLKELLPALAPALAKYVIANYVNFNVFWDLFLCTLFYFFITYQPKRMKAKGLLLFRMCAVLPVIYVIGAIFLDGLNKKGMVELPVWAVALLPNRRIACYALFFLIVLFLKYKEAEIKDMGGSREDFLESLNTRRSSLQFSVFACISILVVCGIDFLLKNFQILSFWGFGKFYNMFMAIPFVMLFSFNKMPKRKWPDVFVPIYYVVHYICLSTICFLGIIAIPELMKMFFA